MTAGTLSRSLLILLLLAQVSTLPALRTPRDKTTQSAQSRSTHAAAGTFNQFNPGVPSCLTDCSPPPEGEIDPRYGVEKRLVPTGPNPLHNWSTALAGDRPMRHTFADTVHEHGLSGNNDGYMPKRGDILSTDRWKNPFSFPASFEREGKSFGLFVNAIYWMETVILGYASRGLLHQQFLNGSFRGVEETFQCLVDRSRQQRSKNWQIVLKLNHFWHSRNISATN